VASWPISSRDCHGDLLLEMAVRDLLRLLGELLDRLVMRREKA